MEIYHSQFKSHLIFIKIINYCLCVKFYQVSVNNYSSLGSFNRAVIFYNDVSERRNRAVTISYIIAIIFKPYDINRAIYRVSRHSRTDTWKTHNQLDSGIQETADKHVDNVADYLVYRKI